MEKVWVIEDPDSYLKDQTPKSEEVDEPPPTTIGKSPAIAYTLSIIFLGSGQLYIGQKAKGEWFLFIMLLAFFALILVFESWFPLIQFLHSHDISYAGTFLFVEVLYFFALIFWSHNAGDAYHGAIKTRATPFTGIKGHYTPFLCSLLIPGWGQFINGQPVKGSIFMGLSILSFFSLLSIPATVLAWPHFKPSEARFIIEAIFAISVLYLPLIPFIFIFSSYDALKVSLDDLKKESLLYRMKAANNRRRQRGLWNNVLPHLKSFFALGLVLTFILTVIYFNLFPKQYYVQQLKHIQSTLRDQDMTLVPDLIDRLQLELKGLKNKLRQER
jgi:TM2 domain-containing membrane protein YozV